MDPVQQLITQGGLGLMAGTFLWLYLQERREHKATRDKYEKSLDDRRIDAKDTIDKIEAPLSAISQGISNLNDKVVVAQSRGKR